jgi:signal transduction histidine kinase
MFKGVMDRALRRYEGADPAVRMRAKLFFLIYLVILVLLPVAIAYSGWSHLHNPALGFRLNPQILIPEALTLLPLAAIFVLLLRGRFSLSAHLLLAFLFLAVWVVMFLDRSGELSRLDTIVFILGIMTLTPLAVVRRKWMILLYGGLNLVAFVFFMLHIGPQLQLPLYRYLEYVADNAMAMVFITLTAFSVFVINQRALQRMEEELAERRRQEAEARRLQAQLVHAHKMESVGRLAGGVAHDFNNLLTMIMGNTSMALTRLEAASPAAARLKDVMRAAESAATLTRQLLAFSRRQPIEPRPLDLNRHVQRIARLLERLLGADVRTVLKLGAVGPVMADPAHVEQILINLAVNARDAMPGGGTLAIETRPAPIAAPPATASPVMKPGDYVALVISDTGIGIAAADIPRIFDPFFTTKPVGQGTGLGLASVYGAVQQSGGSIEVRSTPGQGTVMTVYFPATGLPARAGEAPAAAADDLPGGSESVLLVEDDALVLEFIQVVLASLGYRVQTAADGAAALALAAAPGARFDLLLADVILPDMTGTTLAARALPGQPGARLLCMSGHAEDVAMHDRAVAGRVHFIAKPFTAQQLALKVRDVLDGDRP